MRFLLTMVVCTAMAMLPVQSDAFDVEQSLKRLHQQYLAVDLPDARVAQKSHHCQFNVMRFVAISLTTYDTCRQR